MFPVLVLPFLFAIAIELGQIGSRRSPNAGCLSQLGQKLVIALPGVAAHDAAHGRVRLECRGIDRERFPFDQPGDPQTLKHPREHRPMDVQIDQSPPPRYRRMIRRRLGQRQTQKPAHSRRVRRPPRHVAFRLQAFEVAKQQQTEILSRPSHLLGIERPALCLDKLVEPVLGRQPIELLVKRVAHRPR